MCVWTVRSCGTAGGSPSRAARPCRGRRPARRFRGSSTWSDSSGLPPTRMTRTLWTSRTSGTASAAAVASRAGHPRHLGLDVDEHVRAGQLVTDGVLEAVRDRVRLAQPGVGADGDDESTKSRPAAWRMRTRRTSTGWSSSASRIAAAASPDARSMSTSIDWRASRAATTDDDGDDERGHGVGLRLARGDEDQADDDRQRAGEIGGEMQGVRAQRGGVEAARRGSSLTARGVDAITTPSTANVHHAASTSWALGEQAADGRPAQEGGDEDQERALAQRGEVLGLAVAVVVLGVGRAHGDADRESVSSAATRSVPEWAASATSAERAAREAGDQLDRDEEAAAATLKSAVRCCACRLLRAGRSWAGLARRPRTSRRARAAFRGG